MYYFLNNVSWREKLVKYICYGWKILSKCGCICVSYRVENCSCFIVWWKVIIFRNNLIFVIRCYLDLFFFYCFLGWFEDFIFLNYCDFYRCDSYLILYLSGDCLNLISNYCKFEYSLYYRDSKFGVDKENEWSFC